MRTSHSFRLSCRLLLTAAVWILGTGFARAQFTQNRDTIKVDRSGFPADIQNDYRLFRAKCNQCHGLDTSLKMALSPDGWNSEVKKMQAMASSQFNDKQAASIIAFLNYYTGQQKSQQSSATAGPPSDAAAAGREFYYAQSCDACHAIAGKGGSAAPPLDDVGKRLTREELTQRMQGRRAGTVMPPLPEGTTDQQIHDLVEFLLTLKGR